MPFGRALTLGVEEELLLLDAETLDPVPAVDTVVPEKTDRLKTELFACLVETTTDVCADADEALGQLRELRREVTDRAAPHGLVLAGSGTHPTANPEEQQIVDEPRYHKMVAELGGVARGQLVCGLHVHVGMPSEEACLRAMEGTLPWLPVVLGLSANSPYLAGEDTGLRSSRSARLQELPRADVPPYFASWADWETFMAGRDYTRSWWDVRPHPRLGTLEIRIADQPSDVRRAAALAALLQALAAVAAESDPPPADRATYLRERERSAREPLPSGELAELLTATPEADRQLELGRSEGLRAVTADIVERSRV